MVNQGAVVRRSVGWSLHVFHHEKVFVLVMVVSELACTFIVTAWRGETVGSKALLCNSSVFI
jgi:hypothetical protein